MKIDLTYNIKKDIEFFIYAENINIEIFSQRTGISKTLLNEIFKKGITTDYNYERIYSYIYNCGYTINKVKEELQKETNKLILFHGSKKGLDEINIPGSRNNCDFGCGFYLGESYSNAVSFVCENDKSSIYSFELDLSDLKVLEFECSLEWMIAICYYRNSISEYVNSSFVKSIIKKIDEYDVIIAPIADNRMFYIMTLFANGDINANVALHSLSASYLGKQYVLKTNKAISKLKPIERYYLSKPERDDFIDQLENRTIEIETKLKMAKREFRDGPFIEEVLK